MKFVNKLASTTLLAILSLSNVVAQEDYTVGDQPLANSIDMGALESSSSNPAGDPVPKYLLNFGAYLGYDLDAKDVKTGSTELLNIDITKTLQNDLITSTIGAITVAFIKQVADNLVPQDLASDEYLNKEANVTLKDYSSPSNSSGVSVSKLIDQEKYPGDPVSQAVLNILGTPNTAYCDYNSAPENAGKADTCIKDYKEKLTLNQLNVMSGILGNTTTATPIDPDPDGHLSTQLNSNVLIAPLMYSNTKENNEGGSGKTKTPGLPADSQSERAANFIRYVSGAVTPLVLPRQSQVNDFLSKTGTQSEVQQALNSLSHYFASLRVYAAQSSVGFSNLYYILSKRLSQDKKPSQALNEFNMATRRLSSNPEPKWIDQINKASPATVQKEIAILLAEINYQLYLNRQQEERILLTNTTMLFQNALKLDGIPRFPEEEDDTAD